MHHVRPARSVPLAAALGAAAFLGAAPAAHAAPGDNGTVKIHRVTTPVPDQRDNPQVCAFYLDAFHFAADRRVDWRIDRQPAAGRPTALRGTLTPTRGAGHTGTLRLPNGRYQLFWHVAGEHGKGLRHKVFTVLCNAPGGHHAPGHHPGNPRGRHHVRHHVRHHLAARPGGGVAAGDGSTVKGPDNAELATGGALLAGGLAGSGALMRRRRRDSAQR